MAGIAPEKEEFFQKRRETDLQVDKAEETIENLRASIKDKSIELGALRNESEMDKPPSMTALEEDLDRYKEELEKLSRKKEVADAKLREVMEEADRARKAYEERQKEVEENQAPDRLKARLDEIEDRERRCASDRKHYERKNEEYGTTLKSVEKNVDQRRKEHDQILRKAMSRCERPPGEPAPAEKINKELTRLEEMAKRQESIQVRWIRDFYICLSGLFYMVLA